MATRKSKFRLAAALLAAGFAIRGEVAVAHGSQPRDAPVDRLVTNLEARLSKSPDDANLHYILGRLHGLAFETGSETVPGWMRRGRYVDDADADWRPAEAGDIAMRRIAELKGKSPSNDAQMRQHLRDAVVHLNRAIELAPAIASYHVALASVLEAGVAKAGEMDVSPCCPVRGAEIGEQEGWLAHAVQQLETASKPDAIMLKRLQWSGFGLTHPSHRDQVVSAIDAKRRLPGSHLAVAEQQLLLEDWKQQIEEQFFVALVLALPSDGGRSSQPITAGSLDRWLAHEAAIGYVRVVTARGPRPDENVRLVVAKAALDAFEHLPRSLAITPIVFSLDRARRLADLLDPSTTTRFDLDGSGVPQAWTWVARDTALLCWDPTHSGRITSGRQLFGSVSWWLFFAHGYDALDALDDDRDGKLAGPELTGLAGWIDRNGNGVSDPGEVVPIEQLGVVELSCRATGFDGESPCNRTGLRLASGAVLPTYDWVAHAAPEPAR